jgi:hypothetical protein
MNKFIIIIALASLCACTTTTTIPNKLPSITLVAAQICPLIPLINQNILAFPNISPQVGKNIDAAKPFVDAMCASGAIPTIQNVNDLIKSGFPLLISAVDAAPPLTPHIAEIKAGLLLAEDLATIVSVAQAQDVK